MKIAVTTPPQVEPITLRDVYDWLRIDTSFSPAEHEHDNIFNMLIESARQQVEKDTRRCLMPQTLDLYASWFCVELLRPPIISVTSIRYYDENNVLQTLSPNVYFVEDGMVPRIALADGQTWPSVYPRQDAVIVRYRAGYEATGSPSDLSDRSGIPGALKQACLVQVQMGYDYMRPTDMEALRGVYDRLVDRFAVPRV